MLHDKPIRGLLPIRAIRMRLRITPRMIIGYKASAKAKNREIPGPGRAL
tara:strand:+ start:373 stop:519 length:147 start_codon:yes stop_codon:yes gene_type:complete